MKIEIIFGVNMGALGTREPEKYGESSLQQICNQITEKYKNKHQITFFQCDIEGEICSRIFSNDCEAIVINAGAYTHYSIAIRDAIAGCNKRVIEVHQTNLFAREQFRQVSVIAPVCEGTICGFGEKVYSAAIECLTV